MCGGAILLEDRGSSATGQHEEEKTARRLASSVRLPGFRPGKAPAAMVRKRFKDAIRQQVLENLVQEAFKEVIEREKLDDLLEGLLHEVLEEIGRAHV